MEETDYERFMQAMRERMITGDLPKITVPRGGIRWPVRKPATPTQPRRTGKLDYALQMLNEQRDSESKARAAEIVQRVKALSVEHLHPGIMVSFVKRFSGDKAYTYLALKTVDRDRDAWYVTGKDGTFSNARFEDLLAEKLGFEDFTVLGPAVTLGTQLASGGSQFFAPDADANTAAKPDAGKWPKDSPA